MAEFTLSIKTEDAAELRGIVDRIAGVESNMLGARSNVVARNQQAEQYAQGHADLTEATSFGTPDVVVTNNTDAVIIGVDMAAEDGDYSAEVTLGARDEHGIKRDEHGIKRDEHGIKRDEHGIKRDKHGIKRDERIHANAAEPYKADGTWKRRKNLTDDQYDEVYLELVREAQAAGVYTGPVVPELELEARVEDAAPPAAPAPVAAAPAPTPAAGMSAQATPTPNAVVMKLMPLAGPAAFPALFTALGVPNIMNFSPEQLRLADDVATALRDRIESEGALVTNAAGAVSSSPEWKAANPNALIETAQLFGLV